MDRLEELGKRLGIQFVSRGASHLLTRDDAFRLLELCEVERVRVLGMDGFSQADTLTPIMELIADFSALDSALASVRAARELLELSEAEDALFDVVL